MEEIENLDKLLEQWKGLLFEYFPKVILACLLMVFVVIIAKLVRIFVLRLAQKYLSDHSDATELIALISYSLFLLSGFFLSLEVMGLGSVLSKLLAGAGVIGIIAGFAFKDIASNVFAGFLLNIQRPFHRKDWVCINNQFGTIRTIGWITTTIYSATGQEVFVPNQLIYNSAFINYSAFKKRCVILKGGVSYGDDLEEVQGFVIEEVKALSNRLKKEEIEFYYTGIGESNFDFEIRFWIKYLKQSDYLNAKSEIIMRVKKRFEEEGVSISYPIVSLDFGAKGTSHFSESSKV